MLLAVLWRIFDRFFLQQTKNLFFSKKTLDFLFVMCYTVLWFCLGQILIRRDME